MTEADVALTDYALALECVALAWLLWRARTTTQPLIFWFIVAFSSTAFAALVGVPSMASSATNAQPGTGYSGPWAW